MQRNNVETLPPGLREEETRYLDMNWKRITQSLLAAVLGGFSASATVHAGANIASHEASYSLTLLEAEPGSETTVEGQYLVRVDRSCQANRIATYLQVHLSNVNGRPVSVEDTYSISESLDGSALTFKSRQTLNGQVMHLVQGEASKGKDGGKVVFVEPSLQRDLLLASGTVFPFEAMEATLVGMAEGKKGINQIMFDPSVGDTVMVADLFVGTPSALDAPPTGDVALLQGDLRRTVSTYYELYATDGTPITTAIVDILPNGVSPRAVFDLGKVKALAELTGIRKLPPPQCD